MDETCEIRLRARVHAEVRRPVAHNTLCGYDLYAPLLDFAG
jgi:hypothetical protein